MILAKNKLGAIFAKDTPFFDKALIGNVVPRKKQMNATTAHNMGKAIGSTNRHSLWSRYLLFVACLDCSITGKKKCFVIA
ncbi:hypothetical protein [Moraxella bovis]|uniref:hypothetical protein n=1 Tax=Moraxella bovis TaxID=476 RepID=UPI00117DD356|nr:hypothetical protein [Moraxella bovis]